jgi:hypothetical protein
MNGEKFEKLLNHNYITQTLARASWHQT